MHTLLRGWTNNYLYRNGYMQYPYIKSADGIYLFGADGKKYIDTKSQMMNVSFGHNVPVFYDAIVKQLETIAYIPTMDSHANESAEKFSDMLLSLCAPHFQSVYCSSSGTECCEIAIQIARNYFFEIGKQNKSIIVSIEGCYHGNSTMLSQVSEYDEESIGYRIPDTTNYAKVIRPYCYRCPLKKRRETCSEQCADRLREQLDAIGLENICGVIFEVVQGNGAIELPSRYIETLIDISLENDILLIADEVMTGFGRTGYDFAVQKYGLKPNIMCLSKTLSNGLLPLAATVFDKKITEVIIKKELCTGSTQDGNPVCTELGIAVLKHYQSYPWANNNQELGTYFIAQLAQELADCMIVGNIRGSGLLIGIELVDDKISKRPYTKMSNIHQNILNEGLFVFIENNNVLLTPPYIIDKSNIDDIVQKLKAALTNN